jgi:hypothetical protein
VHVRGGAKLVIPAGVEPGRGPVPVSLGVSVAGPLAKRDARPERGFGSLRVTCRLSVAGSLSVAGCLAERIASAPGPSRPG